MISRFPVIRFGKGAAALLLVISLAVQVLPMVLQHSPSLSGAPGHQAISLTAFNICDSEQGWGMSGASDFILPPSSLLPPRAVQSVPGVSPVVGSPAAGPARRLFRPPRARIRF